MNKTALLYTEKTALFLICCIRFVVLILQVLVLMIALGFLIFVSFLFQLYTNFKHKNETELDNLPPQATLKIKKNN